MKKILVTGASGMLGATLVNHLSQNYDVYATGKSIFKKQFKKYLKFDLSRSCYKKLFQWSDPDLIVHCAAITDGNFCENNPKKAYLINSKSISKLIAYSKKKVKIIYISTDAVFPSTLSMCNEKDITSPENIYGKSKELAEKELIKSDRNYIIIRTTIVGLNINNKKQGFVEWILNSSKKNKKISLFDDVLFNPISIWDLSKEIDFVIQSGLKNGIYHISGSEVISKFNFGISLLNFLNFETKNITKGKIINFTKRAKRSTDQTLDSSKYEKLTKRKLPNVKKTITKFKNYI